MKNKQISDEKGEIETKLNGRQKTFLDLFRIIAAFLVLIGHSCSFYQLSIFRDQTHFPYVQNIGVVMLFLLSGFLSAYSLNVKNIKHNYRFGEYIKHKATRIYRELFPGLLIIAFIDYIAIKLNRESYSYIEAYSIKQFIGNLLMLENMGPEGFFSNEFIPFGSGRPLWTLAVEWWLYLLFGFIFLTIANKEKISFWKTIQMLIIVTMISNYLITGRGAGLGFVFLLGISSFYIHERIDFYTARILFPLSCIGYICYGMICKEAYTVYSFIILWIVFCSALQVCVGGTHAYKRNKAISFISKGTFFLYLLHYSIIDLLMHSSMHWAKETKFVVGIVLSLVISYLAYYVFGDMKLLSVLYCYFFRRKLSNTQER